MSGDSGDETNWRQSTRLVRGGTRRSAFDETCEGLFMTSGYVYATAEEAAAAFKGDINRHQYSRFSNPTVEMFETRLALLEGADACRATATGMAAVFASMASFLKAGDRVVSARQLFGSCYTIVADILPRLGVETIFVDGCDLEDWRRALDRPTDAVFLETPSNPTLDIVDIAAVADLSHAVGARVIVDNVFATPMLQKPLTLGADVVVYSATKHIDGQGRSLGGAVLANDTGYIDDHLVPFIRNTGPSLSPFNAWILLKDLETLELRVERHCANAAAVAAFLADRPEVTTVRYPGRADHPRHDLASRQMRAGGTLVSFVVPGGQAAAFRLLNALRLIDISNNPGDAKSLATHPAATTHHRFSAEERAAMGIDDGLVRLSVGLEDAEDLKDDLLQALAASQP